MLKKYHWIKYDKSHPHSYSFHFKELNAGSQVEHLNGYFSFIRATAFRGSLLGEGGVDRVYFTELCFLGVWGGVFCECVAFSLWKLWELLFSLATQQTGI